MTSHKKNNFHKTLMMAVAAMALSACGDASVNAELNNKVEFTDHSGRSHQLDLPVTSVAAAGMPAEILLYSLVPELMVGWNRNPSPAARHFIPEALLPRVQISSLPDANHANQDAEYIALAPQLIVDYGSMDDGYVDRAIAVQERLGIPFVSLRGKLELIPDVYRDLSVLFGVERRGEELATLAEEILAKYHYSLAGNPYAQKVYITSSDDGLLAAFIEDVYHEVFAWLGVENVAGSEEQVVEFPIGFEQVYDWQPETIFALNTAFLAQARSSAQWQTLPAVQNDRIFSAPRLPFDWLGRPPSVNRLLGLVWVAKTLSPDQPADSFERDIRAIFSTFFHHQLSDADLHRLLAPQ